MDVGDGGSDAFVLADGLPILPAVAFVDLPDVVAEEVLILIGGDPHAGH